MAVKKSTEKQTSSWIGEVEKYSRQIWLAGLGAYSKVSKDGTKLFDTLVKDGEKAEKLAKSEVDKQVGVLKASVGSAKSRVDEVKDKAIGKWSELEEAFDKRLNNAISRLGVPSRNEVKALNDKVDSLTRQLEALAGISATSLAKPAAKTSKAVAKTVGKPAKTAAKLLAKAPAKPAAKRATKPATAEAGIATPAEETVAKPAVKPVAAKKTAAKRSAAAKASAPQDAAQPPVVVAEPAVVTASAVDTALTAS